MKTRILVLLIALLFASPALALKGWFNLSNCTNSSPTDNVTGVTKGQTAYYCIDATSTPNGFSAVFSLLTKVTINRIGDLARTGAGACAVEVYGVTPASSVVTTTTGLSLISGDTDGDGVQNDLSLNGAANRRSLIDVVASAIVFKITAIAAGSEQCVIEVVSTP